MTSSRNRKFSQGTVFWFAGYRKYYILAYMGGDYYNLISLGSGNNKTHNWKWTGSDQAIEIPEKTWECGGPVTITSIPMEDLLVRIRKPDDYKTIDTNLNKKVIEAIKNNAGVA